MKTTIRFPLVKERTGWKRGLRHHRLPAEKCFAGRESCVRGMLRCAIRNRDMASHPSTSARGARTDRYLMRNNALWARVFAGQLEQTDPRLDVRHAKLEIGPEHCPALPL